MNRTQQILTGVLVVQIILAVVTLWPQPAKTEGEALLGGITADQITAFTVYDSKGDEVSLAKSGDTWVIADTDDFPANSETVTSVLEGLVQITDGRTVATTSASHVRLQVADTNYLRCLVVTDDQGKKYTLYLGSTANSGSTHVRMADSDTVYLTDKVTSYDFGSTASSWIETTYVSVDRAKMNKLTLQNSNGTFVFTNEGSVDSEEWVMSSLGSDEIFNSNNLSSMLTKLTDLQMTAPLGKTEKTEYGFAEPSAVITLEYTDADDVSQEVVVTVGTLDETDSTYYVHASNSDYYVKIKSYTMGDFVTRGKADFLSTPTPIPTQSGG